MRLFFRKEGSGDPLVIMHGLYGSSDNWLVIAKNLAKKYTVFSIDHRNHGKSPHNPGHTYSDMKNDLAEFFEEHHIAPAVLLGHSMGGKVAMVFAADYPEKVRKLIIADIAPRNYLEADNMSQYHLHRNILLAILELDVSVLNSRRQAEERLAEKIDNPLITQFLLKNIKHDPLTRRMQWRLNAEALYNNLEEIVEGVNRRWFDDRIPITSYPVVFIRGLKSAYIRDSDIPGIREIYPDAEIIDIPDAGHWLHADQSGLFLRAVMEYC